jgi:hypothetical protein
VEGRTTASYRERDHPDAHYLFARMAYRLEMASMFPNETAVLSCDDMNKVKVGASAVSRYHQLSRYFEVGDSPNMPDHDFPVPGYLLILSGYMLLEDKDRAERSNSNATTEVQTSSSCNSQNITYPATSHTSSTDSQSTTDYDDVVFADFSEYDLTMKDNHIETTETDDDMNHNASVNTSQPELQSDEDNQYNSKQKNKLDKLMRPQLKTEHTGSALVVRAQKFHPSTVETHVNDIYPLLKSLKEQGQSVVVLTVDGSPDWNVSFLANALFFYRLWRKLEQDILIVCCYAALNISGHHSRGVWLECFFPAVLEGDSIPQAQPNLSLVMKKNHKCSLDMRT